MGHPSNPGVESIGLRGAVHRRILRLWYGHEDRPLPAPITRLLHTGSALYARALARDQLHLLRKQRSLPAKIVSVGNIVAGGTGKTPLVLWLAEQLTRWGQRPAILSRGYGRSSAGTSAVPAAGDLCTQAALYGDEPVLMARKAQPVPIWVGRDRYLSGQAAIRTSDADVLLLDDGFQHLALARDLDLVLLDGRSPFGNGSLLPLGPLREPVANLERADAVILTRAEDPALVDATRARIKRLFPGKPLFACRHRLSGFRSGLSGALMPLHFLEGRPAAAFAGIASPGTFFRSLREIGIDLVLQFPFPDHHRYQWKDMERLFAAASAAGGKFLLTTEKDYVRLPAVVRQAVFCAELQLDFGAEQDAFRSYLAARLMPGGPASG